ncbi:MAG: DUF3644 domain-containing protein [Methanoregula sp.]|jgi:hypothetical protein
MKREVKILLDKSKASLLLSIELFNRPHDYARTCTVLILLDHSFEMLLKSSILQKGGSIFDKNTNYTIGFDKCLRIAVGDGNIRFLTDEQVLTLQTINSIRDAQQHYIIDVSENQLYLYVQSGFTLFRDILKEVFDRDLYEDLPQRVLPISTTPPMSLEILYDKEIDEIKGLLESKSRKKSIALSKLKPLMILERSLQGIDQPVTDKELKKKIEKIKLEDWRNVFPHVASIEVVPDLSAPSIALRFTKKEGIPIHVVPEGTPGSHVVAIKRVNDLAYFNMSRNQLADALRQTHVRTDALIWYLKLKTDDECGKAIQIGKSTFFKYSFKSISRIKELLKEKSIEEIWETYKKRNLAKRDSHKEYPATLTPVR